MGTIPKNRLKELREKQKLTLEQVALLTGQDMTTVSKHEAATRGMTPQIITAYCGVFKVQSHELFFSAKDIEGKS